MCKPDIPKNEIPESPEPVKQTEEDVVRARNTARNEAIRRFGVIGTDKTKGALANVQADLKQKTLGN